MASERAHPLVALGIMTPEGCEAGERQRKMMNDYVDRLQREHTMKIEELVRVSLQPKPKYLPEWLWRKLIARIVRLEIAEARHGG